LRFVSISIGRFGTLREREFPDLPTGVVLVLGQNESGKSTLFTFLETILYGFEPADRDLHPYTPWEADRIEGSAGLRMDSSRDVTILRRLLSQPQGRAVHGEEEEDLRNRPLPAVQFLSRRLFRSVYALTMEELHFFDEASWEKVQDGLLGSLGADFLRPVGEVAAELNKEASSLWRSDRKGKPKARLISDRLKELIHDRREASLRDEAIRTMSRRVAEIEEALAAHRDEKTRLRALLYRAERLGPVRAKLRQIEALEKEAGDEGSIAGLPEAPRERIEGLSNQRRDLGEQLRVLEERADALSEVGRTYTDEQKAVLAMADEIGRATEDGARIRADEERIGEIEKRIERYRGRISERARGFLSEPWSEKLAASIRSTSRSALGAHIDRFQDLQVRCRTARERLAAFEGILTQVPGERTLSALTMVLLASGLGLVVAWLIARELTYLVVGLVATFMGAVGLWSWLSTRRDRSRQMEIQEQKVRQSRTILEQAEEQREQVEREIADLLGHLPVIPERLDPPHPELAQDLAALQEILERIEEIEVERQEKEERSVRHRAAILRICEAVGVAEDEDVQALVAALAHSLDEAREQSRRVGEAAEEINRIGPEIDAVKGRMEAVEEEIAELETDLSSLGDGDLDAGIAALDARRRAGHLAREIRTDLERAYPDLDSLREEIGRAEEAEEAWIFSDEEIIRARERVDQAAEAITEMEKEAAGLRSEITHLSGEITLDQIDGEREALEEELQRVSAHRDRLELLASILRRADQQFRETHQPDVLKRAGSYLARITGGRYERLACEQGREGPRLEVFQGGDSFPRQADHPLSSGTLDQIHLALRLALVDHLDEGRERLPLFLDEVLVRWDEERLTAAVDLVRDLASRRQVFLFTCHPWLAERLAESLETRIIEIPAA